MDMLDGAILLDKIGNQYPASEILSSKNIVIYFFNQLSQGDELVSILKQVLKKSKEIGVGLLVVFISCDENEEEFQEELKEQGDWYYLPYKDPISTSLVFKYQVSNVPNCVAVNYDGVVVAPYGNDQLLELGTDVLVVWNHF